MQEQQNEQKPLSFKGLQAQTEPTAALYSLREQTKNYPLVSFLLYSEMDKELAKFVKDYGDWLHYITGSDLYVGVFANPKLWSDSWWKYWEKEKGIEYVTQLKTKIENGEIDPNKSYELAEKLDIDKKALPVIFFTTDLDSHDNYHIHIIRKGTTSDYANFFKDIASCAQKVAKTAKDQRLNALEVEWESWISTRWMAHNGVERFLDMVSEKGPLLKRTADTVGEILESFINDARMLYTIYKITIQTPK